MSKRLGLVFIFFSIIFMISGAFIIHSGSNENTKSNIKRIDMKKDKSARAVDKTPQTSVKGPHPQIFFKESAYDFGKRMSGEDLKHTFVFTNKGDAPLIIEKVKGG